MCPYETKQPNTHIEVPFNNLSKAKLKTYKPEDYQEIKLQGDKFKFLWRYIGKY